MFSCSSTKTEYLITPHHRDEAQTITGYGKTAFTIYLMLPKERRRQIINSLDLKSIMRQNHISYFWVVLTYKKGQKARWPVVAGS